MPSEVRPVFPETQQLSAGGATEEYANMLRRRVNRNGDVHYAGILSDDKALRAYILHLQKRYPLVEQESTPEPEKLAYWINVHNAAVLQLIVSNYPVRSVLDIGLEAEAVYPTDYIALNAQHPRHPFDLPAIEIGGRTWSINALREEAIRDRFKDPRVNFVLVDGTSSAPRLRRGPFTGDKLPEVLDAATREFLGTPVKNPSLNPNALRLSGLFERFYADFGGSDAALIQFVNPYIPVTISEKASISYLPYDWRLNGY